jgi:hypothetical protein
MLDKMLAEAETGKPVPAPTGAKYDASTGTAEHLQNMATQASSPGGIIITADEAALIRAAAFHLRSQKSGS